LIRDGATGGYAKLYPQAVAINLELDKNGKKVIGVHYRRWKWDIGCST